MEVFFISFSIQGVPLENVVCDTRSCMSVMPQANAGTLRLSSIKPTNLSVRLRDSSSAKILGIIYDLYIQIGNTFLVIPGSLDPKIHARELENCVYFIAQKFIEYIVSKDTT